MLNKEAKVREMRKKRQREKKQTNRQNSLWSSQSFPVKIVMKSPCTVLPHCCGDRFCLDPVTSFVFKRYIIVCGQNTIALCSKTLCCLFFYPLCTCNPRPQIFCIASSLHASSNLCTVVAMYKLYPLWIQEPSPEPWLSCVIHSCDVEKTLLRASLSSLWAA